MPRNEPLSAKAAFTGKRLAFIESKLPDYKIAITESREEEFILDVERKYFKRFPITLPHDQDPSDEELEAVDDHTPDQDLVVPNPKDLTDDEYKVAMGLYDYNCNLIMYRKAQIVRWLKYRRSKLAPMQIKDASPDDPMVLFMGKLLGIDFLKKPVKATTVNLWIARTPTARLKAEISFTERKRQTNLIPSMFMKARTDIRQTMFKKLTEDVQKEWAEKAKQEHEKALEAHQDMMNRQPLMDPEEIQLCIDNIPGLLQPILDLIFDWTGWSSTVILGGPEPADKGRLNVVSMHGGATPGPVPLNFGQAFRPEYLETVQPLYGEYLKMCHTPEQCRARSLTGFEERQYKCLRDMAEYDTDNTMNFGVIEFGPSMAERRIAIARSSSTPPYPPGLPHPPQGVLPSHRHKQVPMTSAGASRAPSLSRRPTPAPPALPTTRSVPDTLPVQPSLPVTPSVREIPTWDINPFSDVSQGSNKDSSTPDRAADPTTAPSTLGSTIGSTTRDKGTLLPQKRPREDSIGEPSEVPSATQQVLTITPNGTKQKTKAKARPTARVPPTRPSSVPTEDSTAAPDETAPKKKAKARPSARVPPTRSSSIPSEDSTSQKRKHDESQQQHPDPAAEHSSKRSKSAASTSVPNSSIQSSTAPSSTVPPLPANVTHQPAGSSSGDNPALIGPRKLLTSADFGSKWIEAVTIFQRFERLHPNMPPKTMLGKPHKGFLSRPTCIGSWIARARPPHYRPDEKAIKDVISNFPSWWASLQPDDRVPGTLSNEAEDWSKLRVSTDNGFLNIMAGLFFWRNRINGVTETEVEEWDKSLSDVMYVLRRLVNSAPPSQ